MEKVLAAKDHQVSAVPVRTGKVHLQIGKAAAKPNAKMNTKPDTQQPSQNLSQYMTPS
jgi:hypothetical protein